MHIIPNLAVDGTHLASGLIPLAFFSSLGGPAVAISILNIFIVGVLRYLEMRMRSKERVELEKLRIELEVAERKVAPTKTA